MGPPLPTTDKKGASIEGKKDETTAHGEMTCVLLLGPWDDSFLHVHCQ
jgi:hypothetical protein